MLRNNDGVYLFPPADETSEEHFDCGWQKLLCAAMESGVARSRRSRQIRKTKPSGSYDARQKKRLCRHGLCCIVTVAATFLVLYLFGFLANVNGGMISVAGGILVSSSMFSGSLHDKVNQLRSGLPSRSAFIVINLAKRTDRWSCVSREFRKENIIVEKFVATDASVIFSARNRAVNIMNLPIISKRTKKKLINDLGINTGHLATFVSHTNAINTIVKRQLKIGCIFEDDVTLKSGFLKQFKILYQELPTDWDIFLLSHFCHQGGCEANNGLKPITKNLMPVKMFFSGAGYCLNANSARKLLSTLPCEGKTYCTVAIDGYMGMLAKEGYLKVYRPVSKMVLIPQDFMRIKSYQVKNNDCFSSFNSDIVKFWKPKGLRRGRGCMYNYIASKHPSDDDNIRVRSDGKTYILPNKRHDEESVKGLYIQTVEKEFVVGSSLSEGVVLKYAVENTDNTFFLHQNRISIVVSSDLWRGVSVEVNNLGSTTVDLYWRYQSPGRLMTSYQDVFWHTLMPKVPYRSYIPNKDRTLVAKHYGTKGRKIQLSKYTIFVQNLNMPCHDNALEVEH